MTDDSREGQGLGGKLANLLASHRRFVAEFEKSLRNARHFIALADRSMEQEPENTLAMLNQIREIDLLGHVQRLAEEFHSVQGFVATSPLEEAAARRGELASLSEAYDHLQGEAEQQLEQIQRLLSALKS